MSTSVQRLDEDTLQIVAYEHGAWWAPEARPVPAKTPRQVKRLVCLAHLHHILAGGSAWGERCELNLLHLPLVVSVNEIGLLQSLLA